MPRVTVVIATYNWAEVLPFSIGSVLDQTFTDFQLMVVGDGCTDDSGDVVARVRDPRVSWLNLPANTRHQSGPNNEAIRRSDSDLIAYLGHDDLWMPHHLESLVGALDGGAGVSHGSVLTVFPTAKPIVHPRGSWAYRDGEWLAPTSVVHSRSLVDAAGSWRPPWQTGLLESEADLWSRLSTAAQRPPIWVREVTSLKLPASWRPDVYLKRPHHEQAEWLERIRHGESWDHLIQTTWTERAPFPLLRPRRVLRAVRHRLAGPHEPDQILPTAEQRWLKARRDKGLDQSNR